MNIKSTLIKYLSEFSYIFKIFLIEKWQWCFGRHFGGRDLRILKGYLLSKFYFYEFFNANFDNRALNSYPNDATEIY